MLQRITLSVGQRAALRAACVVGQADASIDAPLLRRGVFFASGSPQWPKTTFADLDSPELAEQIDERQAFHDGPSMGTDLSKLSEGPLFQQHLHLLAGEVLAEPGRALAGQRLGEVFAAGERVERREQRYLGVSDGLGRGRDPHGT